MAEIILIGLILIGLGSISYESRQEVLSRRAYRLGILLSVLFIGACSVSIAFIHYCGWGG
ncbi:hypothetical protein RU97_GL001885 [Enterococcus canis]|uniref:Uncharacterized protein n=1 Tax=Enterococcus canis TaxID=214095 RepID=A0A1L8RFE4_9ENTE|nr:hypothetical protein [Enterococcus canis]OJG18488.1 hypothetical protein RU97_GL001885 [Enterococcus canis]